MENRKSAMGRSRRRYVLAAERPISAAQITSISLGSSQQKSRLAAASNKKTRQPLSAPGALVTRPFRLLKDFARLSRKVEKN